MEVILLSKNEINPIDISIGSARSCYSSKVKLPSDITNWEGKYDLASDLKKAGHHTTLQHVNFTFVLSGVSRLAIWRFFHAHRFYNSDQVSQRYASIDKENFYVNKNAKNKEEITELNIDLIKIYEDIILLLEEDYKKSDNKVEVKNAHKKAMENARYILPQSIFAHLYHTISLSMLLKYYKGRFSSPNATDEIATIVEEMVKCVIETYPNLKYLFEEIDKKNKKEFKYENVLKNIEFNRSMKDLEIVNITELKHSVDHSFYADTDALYFLFNNIESTFNIKIKMNISLSADSQNQRHRTSVGVREDLSENIKKNTLSIIDFVSNQYVPEIFYKNEKALELFYLALEKIYKTIIKSDMEDAVYLLPNSNKIMVIEQTNYSDFIHKSKTRLCLNAQEEIRYLTYKVIDEFKENGLTIDMLAPPCVFNKLSDIKPFCTEGLRFCGIKEWNNKKYDNITLFKKAGE